MPADRIKEVAVLIVIPSPIKYHVNIAYDDIPNAKPKNLPGHNSPSKYSKAYLVPIINVYEIVVPPTRESKKVLFANHFHKNCPLV